MTAPRQPSRQAHAIGAICGFYYRALLVSYPLSFRRAHGADATQVFVDACRESWIQGGVSAVGRRLAAALVDVPRAGFSERLAGDDRPRRRSDPRTRVWTDLAGDVRSAMRSCRRRPTLTAAIITTLALGLGANTAMFSVVDATLLRPLPYANADRVVYIKARNIATDRTRDPTSAELERATRGLDVFERVEGRAWKSVLLTGGDRATRVRMLEVTGGYLQTVGARPIAGRLLGADDARPGAPPVVVLSERLWRTQYGARTDIVGRAVIVDGVSRSVVGVTSDVTSDTPGLRYALFSALPTDVTGAETPVRGVAWLKPGISIEAARGAIRSIALGPDDRGQTVIADVEAPSNIFWESREFRDPQLVLLAGVFLLLVIAAVNVANLLLASGQLRLGEMAMRRALGASRGRVARLLLIESLGLALAGAAAGLFVAWTLVQLFTALDPGVQLQTRLEAVHVNGRVVVYATAIAMLTGVGFGLVPALRGSIASLQPNLRATESRTGSRLRRLPRTFITVEVAMSIVLLIAAGLVGRSFMRMYSTDPGFAADRILSVRVALPESRYSTAARRDAFFDALLSRVSRLPGVASSGLGYGAIPPTDFVAHGDLQVDGRPYATEVWTAISFVQPTYFALMGIPLRAGRTFEADALTQPESENPAIVSESLARSVWSNRDPIGATLQIAERRVTRRYRVIGVAGDVSGWTLLDLSCVQCRWQIYQPLPAKRQYTEVLVRLEDGVPPPVAGLRSAIAEIDPDVPSDDSLETAQANLQDFVRLPRFQAALFGSFAAVAAGLVALGLLAVVFHTVNERTREMGIRLALGARPAQVRRLVVIQGMGPALLGVAIGGVIAAALTRTMSKFLYGVSPIDPLAFIGSAALLMLIAFAAVIAPALRATRVDPVTVLRSE